MWWILYFIFLFVFHVILPFPNVLSLQIENKSEDEKKDFIKKISNNILMKSGTFVNKLYSEANKEVLIQIFKKKKESTDEEMTDDDEEEEEEEEESLTKLSLVNKVRINLHYGLLFLFKSNTFFYINLTYN